MSDCQYLPKVLDPVVNSTYLMYLSLTHEQYLPNVPFLDPVVKSTYLMYLLL